MDSLVANLLHLVLQHLSHLLDHVGVLSIAVAVEQLQRVFLAVKQLPLLVLAAGPRALEAKALVVPVDQLVALVAHAVVRVRLVDDVAVHPVAMVRDLLPVGRRLALDHGAERHALHVRGDAGVRKVEEGRGEVDVADDVLADRLGGDFARVADHKGHLEALLVHEALVEPAVLAQEEALVRRVHDDGVLGEALLVQPVQHAADVVVDALDGAQVALHVALELPLGELLLRLEGEGLARLLAEQFQAGDVLRRGDLAVLPPPDVDHLIADDAAGTFGLHDAQVVVGEVLGDAHLGHLGSVGAVLVVVGEGVGEPHGVLVEVFVLGVVLPRSMGGFVVAHEEEGPALVALVHPLDGLVGDDVGRVAGDPRRLARGLDELRVPVLALAGQHAPVVEARGLMILALAEVPLADHGGLVVCVGPQLLGDVGDALVDLGVERHDAVDVVVRAAEHGGARRRADAVGDVAVVEAHALVGDAVEVGRAVDAGAVARDGLGRVVVRHDEDDVGAAWRLHDGGCCSWRG